MQANYGIATVDGGSSDPNSLLERGEDMQRRYAKMLAQQPGTSAERVDSILSQGNEAANAYEYLGRPGAAAEEAARYRAEGATKQDPIYADFSGDQAVRHRQLGLAQAYEKMSQGGGPSTVQFDQARAMQSAAAQGAMGRVASPQNLAGAQRMSMLGGGASAMQGAMNTGLARAQEISNAYGGMANVAGQMRGQDANNAFFQTDQTMRQRRVDDRLLNHGEDMAQAVQKLQQQGQQARADQVLGYHGLMRAKQMDTEKKIAEDEANELNTVLGVGTGILSGGAALVAKPAVKAATTAGQTASNAMKGIAQGAGRK